MEKWRIFVVKTLHFSNFWDFFQLDLDFTFEKSFECGWTWTEF